MTVFADEAYAGLEPIAGPDEGLGFPLRGLCRAIGSMFAQGEEAIRGNATRDAWERVFNPDEAPLWLLPFIGQSVGVVVDTSQSEEAQIAQIKEEGNWKRGTPGAVLKAVASTLTGGKSIRLVERNSTAWTALIITRPSETPSSTATKNAGNLQKPGGMLFTYEQSDLPLIDEGTKTIDECTAGTIDTVTLAQVT